jgi:DNA replication protein DnaC
MQTFDDLLLKMQEHGMKVPGQRFSIMIDDSKKVFSETMKYFLSMENKEFVFLKEYDEIVEWLSNNNGRGMFMHGMCGRGKSLLARYVLPAIIASYCRKIVAIYDMAEVNANLDEVLKKNIISIDDVGTESEAVKYGERRMAFSEIVDAAEKYGKLLIVTTNLNHDEIKARYGIRVLDRIMSTTKRVAFNGISMRS